MALRFTGTYEELKEKLAGLTGHGEWLYLNDNQKQFRHNDGGVLNWYSSTGTIQFQGRGKGKATLEAEVIAAISSTAAGDDPQPARKDFPSEISTDGATVPAVQTTVAAQPAPRRGTSGNGRPAPKVDNQFLGQKFADSELVIGLVGAVGTELKQVTGVLEDRLKVFGYTTEKVRLSADIIPKIVQLNTQDFLDEHSRISKLMDAGNQARLETGDNSVLALGVAAKIASSRFPEQNGQRHRPRHAYIINSLKHPEEVARLREIYPEGFCLIGVHSDEKRRHEYLVNSKRLTAKQAEALMGRDEDEHLPYGQRTSDTFHLSDAFARIDENHDKLKNSLWRILNVLFGSPYVTPTFDEYAMFMAFAAAVRSADLSRQVGAVVARDNEIIATGANDCPKYGGGLYWPEYDDESHEIKDAKDGRDYMRGEDVNKAEQKKIIEDVLQRVGNEAADIDKVREALEASRIVDITEYGRMVHAEMEALLSCARNNVSARKATLYCTTFPCHNCAKHVVAAGITRVVYIEPYPKSRAAEFHSDSISLGFSEKNNTVHFEPFVGVGPRRFLDLFSMQLGSGYPLQRKDPEGQVLDWKPGESKLRIQMLPCSYVELEISASSMFNEFRKLKEDACDE